LIETELRGNAADEIVKNPEGKFDLIIMGARIG
jgi:hypothetical protein